MQKIKIYLDEDVRPLLAIILRKRGFNTVSCKEKKLFGLTDEEQLNTAVKEKRAILTHNIKDFSLLHKEKKGNHYGIIFSDQVPLSILLKRTLKFLSRSKYDDVKGNTIWLSNYK